jgi:hypothetical protein
MRSCVQGENNPEFIRTYDIKMPSHIELASTDSFSFGRGSRRFFIQTAAAALIAVTLYTLFILRTPCKAATNTTRNW